MNDKESITDKQAEMEKLTVGKLKQLLNNKELHDSDEVFADYPGGWSGVFQVYRSDNRLFLLASDNFNDSGIGGGVTSIDTQLWKSADLDADV
jgi:hypothetical protein